MGAAGGTGKHNKNSEHVILGLITFMMREKESKKTDLTSIYTFPPYSVKGGVSDNRCIHLSEKRKKSPTKSNASSNPEFMSFTKESKKIERQ